MVLDWFFPKPPQLAVLPLLFISNSKLENYLSFFCFLRIAGNSSCSALPTPSNGTKFGCPENATVYNDAVCQFSCNDGYIGSGSQVRRCQHNGTWSGQDFTCHSTHYTGVPNEITFQKQNLQELNSILAFREYLYSFLGYFTCSVLKERNESKFLSGLDSSRHIDILRNNTTLLKFKNMFRQKLLSSSVESQSIELNKFITPNQQQQQI